MHRKQPRPFDIGAAAEKIGPGAAVPLDRAARVLAQEQPRSLNQLARALRPLNPRTVQRHLYAARAAGLIHWSARRRTSPVRAASITIGPRPAPVKQADQLGVTGRDEHIPGADARRNVGPQDAGANVGNELIRNRRGHVGIDQGDADQPQRFPRIGIGQDRPAAQGANGSSKGRLEGIEHAPDDTDPTPERIEAVRDAWPNRYAANTARPAAAAAIRALGFAETLRRVQQAAAAARTAPGERPALASVVLSRLTTGEAA